jgi:hypothetical protein
MYAATAAIIRLLRERGWHVVERRGDGRIEFEAVLLGYPSSRRYAEVGDGDGPQDEHRAAVLLAEACRVDSEDG